MKIKILSFFIFLATIILITAPLLMLSSAASTGSFSASVSLSNSAPTIEAVYNGSGSPAEGTTATINLLFNATDLNGVADINVSSAFMNITRSGETARSSTSCTSAANLSNTETINCTITIYWYDGAGTWNICAYVRDNSNAAVSNCTAANFTMGTTDSITLLNASIAFSGTANQTGVGPQHIIVNNTGNVNYTSMGVNATYLANVSYTIGVGNFSVNVSNSVNGQALTENSFLSVTSSNLTKGPASQRDLYFGLNIPNVPALNYNSNRNWVIDPS